MGSKSKKARSKGAGWADAPDRRALDAARKSRLVRRLLLALAVAAVAIVCSPYLLRLKSAMERTTRGGGGGGPVRNTMPADVSTAGAAEARSGAGDKGAVGSSSESSEEEGSEEEKEARRRRRVLDEAADWQSRVLDEMGPTDAAAANSAAGSAGSADPTIAAKAKGKGKSKTEAGRMVESMKAIERGSRFLKEGDMEAAKAEFTAFVEHFEDSSLAWERLGAANFGLGDMGEALTCFERATALAPSHATAVANKARTLGMLHRDAEALVEWHRYVLLASDKPEGWVRRGGGAVPEWRVQWPRRGEADRRCSISPR